MVSSQLSIPLQRGLVFFEELSYLEYKNICKMLLSNELGDINNCFETITQRISSSYDLNIIDKFEALIYIRNSILGNNITLTHDDRDVNFSLKEQCIGIFREDAFEYGGCKFRTPKCFLNKDITATVADYLYEVNGNDLDEFSIHDKTLILNETDIHIIKVAGIINEIKDKSDVAILDNRAEINVYNVSILYFLREIFNSDLMEMYEFEYNISRRLNLKGRDLLHYTLPELKISLNFYTKEQTEKAEAENSGSPDRGE
tara:strand:- start:1803 stop:2576 length:774 start_codon:yes stop_codon:yes gene_type:complete